MASNDTLRKKHARISMSENVIKEEKPKSYFHKPSKIRIASSLYNRNKSTLESNHDEDTVELNKIRRRKKKKSSDKKEEVRYRTRKSSETSSNASVDSNTNNFKRKIETDYRGNKKVKTNKNIVIKKEPIDLKTVVKSPIIKLCRLDETNPEYYRYLQRINIRAEIDRKKRNKTVEVNESVKCEEYDRITTDEDSKSDILKNVTKPVCKSLNSTEENKTKCVKPSVDSMHVSCLVRNFERFIGPTKKENENVSVPFTERQTSYKSSELTVKIPEKKTQPLKLRRDNYRIEKPNDSVRDSTRTESNNNSKSQVETKTEPPADTVSKSPVKTKTEPPADTVSKSPSRNFPINITRTVKKRDSIDSRSTKENKINTIVQYPQKFIKNKEYERDFSDEELNFSSDFNSVEENDDYDTESTVTTCNGSSSVNGNNYNVRENDSRNSFNESEVFNSNKKKLNFSKVLSTSNASLNSTTSTENSSKKKKHFKNIEKHLMSVDDAFKADNLVVETQRHSSLDSTNDYENPIKYIQEFDFSSERVDSYKTNSECSSFHDTEENSRDSDFTSNDAIKNVKPNLKHVLKFSSPAKRPPKPTPLENKDFKIPSLPKRINITNPVKQIKPDKYDSLNDPAETISLYAESIFTTPVEETRVFETKKYDDVYNWIHKCPFQTDPERSEPDVRESEKKLNETTTKTDIFKYICPKILSFGVCQRIKTCSHVHDLPCNWENTVENMSANEISSLYDDVKDKKYLYVFKKMFKHVTSILGQAKDLNKLTRLSEDIMQLNMDTDCTPFIVNIVQAIENSNFTFQSAIDLVYKGANLNQEKKNTLADILLYIIVDDDSPLENNWMNVQMLTKNRKNLDSGFVQEIISNCLKEPPNASLCSKIYRDIIINIPDAHFRYIFHTIISKFVKLLESVNMKEEASSLYKRWDAENKTINDTSDDKRVDKPIQNSSPNQLEIHKSTQNIHQHPYLIQSEPDAHSNRLILNSSKPYKNTNKSNYSVIKPFNHPVQRTYPPYSVSNDEKNWYKVGSVPNQTYRPLSYQQSYSTQDRRKIPPQSYNQAGTSTQTVVNSPIDLKKIPRENYGTEQTTYRSNNNETKSYFTKEYFNQNTRPSSSHKSNITIKSPQDGALKTIEVYRHTIPSNVQRDEEEIKYSDGSEHDSRSATSEFNGRSNMETVNFRLNPPQTKIQTYIPTAITKLTHSEHPIDSPSVQHPIHNYEISNFQNKIEYNVVELSRNDIEQAFSSENTSNIFKLIQKYKNDNIEQFLSIAIDVLLNQSHNLPTFFNSLSEKLRIFYNTDNDTKHVIMTIGMNILISETESKCWNNAIKILRLIDLYPKKELCKIYHREFSVGKKILALCHVMIHSESSFELNRAWRNIKDGKFDLTYQNWTYDSIESDIKYRDQVVNDFFQIMNKKQIITLEILTNLVQQEHNDIDVNKYVDEAIILAVNNNSTISHFFNLHLVFADWVNHVQATTFRAFTIKMVKEKWLHSICFDLYEIGASLDIYPQYSGNESTIILNSDLCTEEIQVIVESFLIKREYFKLDTPIKIQPRQVMKFTPIRNVHYPKLFDNVPSDLKTMTTRIVNSLRNGPLRFPDIVINDSSYSVVVPPETINHCVKELKLLSKLKKK